MSVVYKSHRSNSLIKYLLTELEQVDTVNEAGHRTCNEELNLWARYASQQLYFEGHESQSECIFKLSEGLADEEDDSSRGTDDHSELVFRIEIYREILETLLSSSEEDSPDTSIPQGIISGPKLRINDEKYTNAFSAHHSDLIPIVAQPGSYRPSFIVKLISLLLIGIVLAASTFHFFTSEDFPGIVMNLIGGITSPRPKVSGSKNLSGIVNTGLGDTNSIFLTRIDESPEDQKQQTLTVWLAATGKFNYTIDKIEIKKLGGTFEPKADSDPQVNADYDITYWGGDYDYYPISPPLRVYPAKQEIPVTVVLRLASPYGNCCYRTEMQMHYHCSDGSEGKLYLKDVPEDAATLSRLLETDIQFHGLITTPKGMQRGDNENRADAAKLIYEPIEDVLVSTNKLMLTPERIALEKAIERKALLPKIIELLDANKPMAFDLCATLPDARCSKALMQAGASGDRTRKALYYLSLRHFLKPSTVLADFILSLDLEKYTSVIGEADDFQQPIRALAYHRTGRWAQALLRLASIHGEAFPLLNSMRERLTKEEGQMAEEFCLKELNGGSTQLDVIDYLHWRGYSEAEIESRWQHLKGTGNRYDGN